MSVGRGGGELDSKTSVSICINIFHLRVTDRMIKNHLLLCYYYVRFYNICPYMFVYKMANVFSLIFRRPMGVQLRG